MSIETEVILMWAGVTFYALSSIAFLAALFFKREVLWSAGLWLGAAGLLPHLAAIVGRWIRIDRGPYLGFYEVVSSYAIIAVALFVFLAFQRRNMVGLGIILMPLAFIMLGISMFTSKEELALSGPLASWWLSIHVIFAKIGYGAFLVSFAFSMIYLFRHKAKGLLSAALEKMPQQEILDDLQFRFAGLGFIFYGIMIVSGAIWANEAWGRYWAWDPIETWSLIAWVVYALFLHARLTLGWSGNRLAWFSVVALPVVSFSLMGVPLVYDSIHGAYLLGY